MGDDQGKAKQGPKGEPKPARRKDDAPPDHDEKENLDTQLDEELEDSFPASDPPSLTQDPH